MRRCQMVEESDVKPSHGPLLEGYEFVVDEKTRKHVYQKAPTKVRLVKFRGLFAFLRLAFLDRSLGVCTTDYADQLRSARQSQGTLACIMRAHSWWLGPRSLFDR